MTVNIKSAIQIVKTTFYEWQMDGYFFYSIHFDFINVFLVWNIFIKKIMITIDEDINTYIKKETHVKYKV